MTSSGVSLSGLQRDIPEGFVEVPREEGRQSWPSIQPTLPRKSKTFLCGNRCGCCPLYILGVPFVGLALYALGFVALVLLTVLAFLVYSIVGCPLFSVWSYAYTWRCTPWYWLSDIYIKMTYLAYQALLLSRASPDAGPKHMPPSEMRPKALLKKSDISYALNIRVPHGYEEEFTADAIMPNKAVMFAEESLAKILPQSDYFDEFAPGEDPVKFVMQQVDNVFPVMHQVWDDKWSDQALTRFCLHGLGAHRVERVQPPEADGKSVYVLRTNQLSQLPVRKGFARYGGDAYFDAEWRPVKIVDLGLRELREDRAATPWVVTPNESDWEHAKFRFRSSMSVLVTLVDHLYGIHLQTANLVTTAVREQLSADHPVRRFLTPFTFQTISVNHNARNNLVQPRSMGTRCFGFDDKGMGLAFAAAPSLLMSGLEVPKAEGGPIFDRIKYCDYLKGKGIDTEYYRQCRRLCEIFKNFVANYLGCYYGSPQALAADKEVGDMLRQVAFQLEFVAPGSFNAGGGRGGAAAEARDLLQRTVDLVISILVNFMFVVTAGHEQVGSIEAYVQDASFCAFKWTPNSMAGTKQTATAQALLMSFTSTPMPKLLNDDWSHLFPAPRAASGGALPGAFGGKGTGGGQPPSTPQQAFQVFQEELKAMAADCNEYNQAAASRPFPECFPMYTLNPELLETSISV